MAFEIAINNGMCTNGIKILNSIKAAYLYADKVRVYEPYQYDFSHTYAKGSDDLISHGEIRWVIDGFFGLVEPSIDLHEELPQNKKEIAEYLGERLPVSEIMEYKREASSEQYRQDSYHRILEDLGIECITPTRGIDGGDIELHQHSELPEEIEIYGSKISIADPVLINTNKAFLNDRAFKLFNYLDDLSNFRELIPSMWAPAYLSEYAISKLPGFEDAMLDEMKDIRKELNGYIVPYRKAIVEVSQKIKEIADAGSLQQECAALYLEEIDPKVAAINAAIRDNNIFKNIARSAIKSETAWTGISNIILALATTGDVSRAVTLSTAISLGGYSTVKGLTNTLEEDKKIKANEMFFLYEAGNIIKNEYSVL